MVFVNLPVLTVCLFFIVMSFDQHSAAFVDIPNEVAPLPPRLAARGAQLNMLPDQMEFFSSRRANVAGTLFLVRNALTAPFVGLDAPFDRVWVGQRRRALGVLGFA